jgi:hypothetical protein
MNNPNPSDHNRFQTRALLMGLCGAAVLSMSLGVKAQVLQHRYSFFSATNNAPLAFDLVGTNNGTLNGDAVITGGQLQLDGNAWVQLQPGIVTNDTAVTVEVWGDYPSSGQGTWANLFDFGTQDANVNDSYSISFCVNTGSPAGDLDAAISDFDNANVNRQNCYAAGSLLAGQTGGYVAAVFNPPQGYIAIYVNGSQVGKITGVTNTITPGIRDLNNWIGWDNWPDPKLTANVDEFRVWNGALNGLQIAASYQGGDTAISTNAGSITSIQVSAGTTIGPSGSEPVTVLATAALITNTVDISPLATYKSSNTNVFSVDTNGIIHGVGGGTATVTASYGGKSASQPVTVLVTEPPAVLTHRYSFTSDATDSVGNLNGTLMGTATISNGQVVLDGSTGCYVDLSTNSFADNGIISGYQSATIDYWATFGTFGIWNYAWAFGNTVNGAGQNYVHNVVRANGSAHRIDNSTSAGGASFNMIGDFQNETVHCTTVIDPLTGHLAVYTNGVLSGLSSSDFAPLNSIGTNLIYIGRSLWTGLGPTGTGDPYVVGSFDEFRVYSGTLTPQQIAVADLSGPNNTNVNPGTLQSIRVAVPPMQVGDKIIGPLIANYTGLTNYNVTGNSLTPLFVYTSSNSNIVYQATDGYLHGVSAGSAVLTAVYGGFTNSQTVTVSHTAALVHRYSFHDAPGSTNIADSVGGAAWAGTLPNGGTLTGTNLQLMASSLQYVQLPAGILSNYTAVSIDMWLTTPDQLPVNCMLFAFGNSDSTNASYAGEDYIFCAPQGGRIAIAGVDPGYVLEEGTGGAGDLSFRTNLHVTAVFDPPGRTVAWYTNGVLVSANTGEITPMADVQSTLNYIGRSLYSADPYEDVNPIEFRIYNGALQAADVAQLQQLGPSAVTATVLSAALSNGNLVITWPTTSTGFSLYSTSKLGSGAVWSLVSGSPTTNGANFQVSVPATGTAQFFELKK